MRVIEEEDLLENARVRGEQIQSALREVATQDDRIHEVRGVGLMIGAQMADNKLARAIVTGCKQRGLIVETNLLDERVIRFSPPLIVTADQCDVAVRTFAEALATVER
jgi:4-aminobutyrate aminotransferase-like enzyme